MVKTGDYWHRPGHSAGNLPNLNCKNELLDFKFQCIDPDYSMSSAEMKFRGSTIPLIPGFQAEQKSGLLSFPSHFQITRPLLNPYLGEKYYESSLGLASMTWPCSNTEFLKSGFIIFDQSGNQTSVMYSSGCPRAQSPISISAKNCSYGLNNDDGEEARNIDLKNYLFHKDSLKGEVASEESEMHEDTEEINALLYSDDDNHYSSDDEVTSTGHSPPLIKGLYDDQTQGMSEEVASSDGPRKRQKMLDGGFKKLYNTTLSVKVEGFKKSSYTISQSRGDEMGSGLGNLSSKKDKIRETLRLLESMVPGAEGKDPMFVIDEAIDYLKSLKLKAKTLGVAATPPSA